MRPRRTTQMLPACRRVGQQPSFLLVVVSFASLYAFGMQYLLSVTNLVGIDPQGRRLRSRITEVLAAAELGQYAEFGFPDPFCGKLVNASLEQILQFKSLPEVEVAFRGTWYTFEELEQDGSFKLRRGTLTPKINTDEISEEQKATPKFQSFYQEMLVQLRKPGFIRILCAHEAAHLFYFTMMGLTEYDPHPATIHFDPLKDDYFADMAGVKAIDPALWQEGKFWEWFNIFARALAAGGVVARKLDPTTDGGDEDDGNRFKALCDKLNEDNPKLLLDFEERWKQTQQLVLEDLNHPQIMQAIEEQALVLRREFGLENSVS